MDGIAAIDGRIAMIRTTLVSLRPQPVVTGAPAATSAAPGSAAPASTPASAPASRSATAAAFASALATEVSRTTATPAVAGLSGVQLDNARAILTAGERMGLSLRDRTIGVMTAMGESSLRVLDHGDTAGPDSRGLFQQRDNGAWGTLAQRMDPTASATSFFTALQRVGGRDAMAPTQVAHTVQRNADPLHYATYWDKAVAVVSQLTGATAAQVAGR